jgi:hypothetical protein
MLSRKRNADEVKQQTEQSLKQLNNKKRDAGFFRELPVSNREGSA